MLASPYSTPIKTEHYIYPPRCSNCMPREDAIQFCGDMGWLGQYKFNDSRTLVYLKPDEKPELWSRHAERHRSYNAPDWLNDEIISLYEILGISGNCRLDGGLLDQKHRVIKDHIVIWDIIVQNGVHLLGTTYRDRYNYLTSRLSNNPKPYMIGPAHVANHLTDHIILARSLYTPMQWEQAWQEIEEVNKPYWVNGELKSPLLEGIMFKDLYGKLETGYKSDNNNAWMIKSRVQTRRHRH